MEKRLQISSELYEMGDELINIAINEEDLNMVSGDILKILAAIINNDKLLIEFDNFLKLYTSYKIIEDVGMDEIIKIKNKKNRRS
jgi:hypothetical protein